MLPFLSSGGVLKQTSQYLENTRELIVMGASTPLVRPWLARSYPAKKKTPFQNSQNSGGTTSRNSGSSILRVIGKYTRKETFKTIGNFSNLVSGVVWSHISQPNLAQISECFCMFFR